jgi:hypothetical protein
MALSLCTLLVAATRAGPPAFSTLKQTSDGDVKSAGSAFMPPPADPSIPAGPLGRMVSRDMRTGEVTIRDGVTVQEFLDSVVTPGGGGLFTWPNEDPSAGDKNFSAWSLVANPDLFDKPQHV